ncbi:MAG: ankyrin repeat domain-containing protein, partial [Verrucomicrobiota bacterium]
MPEVEHDPAAALESAIQANDVAQVAEVLERFPALKERLNEALPNGAFGTTPLIAAVRQSNREMVDLLLRSGADINGRSHWWAGSFGVLDNDCGLADFLIGRGA